MRKQPKPRLSCVAKEIYARGKYRRQVRRLRIKAGKRIFAGYYWRRGASKIFKICSDFQSVRYGIDKQIPLSVPQVSDCDPLSQTRKYFRSGSKIVRARISEAGVFLEEVSTHTVRATRNSTVAFDSFPPLTINKSPSFLHFQEHRFSAIPLTWVSVSSVR